MSGLDLDRSPIFLFGGGAPHNTDAKICAEVAQKLDFTRKRGCVQIQDMKSRIPKMGFHSWVTVAL